MADSLVDLISNYFDPNVTTKLASSLGVNLDQVQGVIDAAVPATLAGLASTAMSGEGAKRISDAIGSADQSMLEKLPSLVGNQEIAAGGLSLLGNLIGNDKVQAITQAVSKSTGAPAAATQGILGMLGPAAIGAMSQLDPDAWSSPAGIAKTLMDQKSVIAAAMPAGLGQMLGGLGGASAAMGAAMGAAGSMASQASSSMSMPSNGQSGGIPSWVWIVLLIVVAAALFWYFKMR